MRKSLTLIGVSLVVLAAALVGASAASANNFPIYHCPWTSPSLGTSYAGDAIYVYDGGGIHQPLTLHFGWGASKTALLNNFLAAQSAADGGTIYDSSGNVVWQYGGWGIGGDSSVWSSPFAATLQTPGGTTVNGVASTHNVPIPTLAPGTYDLTLELDLSKTVLDGFTQAKAGAWYKTTSCPFTVQ